MANNTFFNRYIRIQIGELEIDNGQLEIQFTVKSAPEKADEAEIVIYNLTEFTKNNLYPDAPISIEAGYKDKNSKNYGVIHVGKLKSWTDEFDKADTKTTIISFSTISDLSAIKHAKTYPPGTRKIAVAKEQVASTPMAFVQIDESNTDVYTRGKVFTDKTYVLANLQEIAKEIEYRVIERKGGIVFIPKNTGIVEGFVLNSDTGLISCKRMVAPPEDVADPGIMGTVSSTVTDLMSSDTATSVRDFEVTTLLNPALCVGSIIELDSRISNGKKLCRIEELSHSSTGSEHVTQFQVKIM